jgi:hypothetical protein
MRKEGFLSNGNDLGKTDLNSQGPREICHQGDVQFLRNFVTRKRGECFLGGKTQGPPVSWEALCGETENDD